jgi:hypothetical protein
MKLRHFQENGWAIMLSAISQIQEDKYHVFSHMWNLDMKKVHEYKKGTMFGGKPAEGERGKRWGSGEENIVEVHV